MDPRDMYTEPATRAQSACTTRQDPKSAASFGREGFAIEKRLRAASEPAGLQSEPCTVRTKKKS